MAEDDAGQLNRNQRHKHPSFLRKPRIQKLEKTRIALKVGADASLRGRAKPKITLSRFWLEITLIHNEPIALVNKFAEDERMRR